MAESIQDLRGFSKEEAYSQLLAQRDLLLDDGTDDIAAMATIATLVHHGFGHLWTGFYRVVEPGRLLRVGPYQGSIGCLEIAFGRGVCGDAAASGETVIVDDVTLYPGHIACDARSRSEIVLPVKNADGGLLAVFDVDSVHRGAFTRHDASGLESLLAWFAR